MGIPLVSPRFRAAGSDRMFAPTRTRASRSFRWLREFQISSRWWSLRQQLHLSFVKAMPRGKKRQTEKVDVNPEEEEDIEKPPPAKRGRGRPKKTEQTDGGSEASGSSEPKGKKKANTKASDSGGESSKTDWTSVKWTELGQTNDGRKWTKKFSSWNVNGIRAWLKNGGFDYIKYEDPDIFCIQETKCTEDDLPKDELELPGYHIYWHTAEQKGYSGVGLYSKEKPLSVTNGLGIEKYDCEGRIITAEYDNFYFLTSYVPNAGQGLKRLGFKQEWDVDLREYMKKLDAKKPVILCGDLNVAHLEIDLKNPKTNRNTAGFTAEEREDFTQLLKEGFVDTFRHLYPDLTEAYTYWGYRFNCRAKNIGWRLDYFVVSERLLKDVCDCVIRNEVYGSDHCPLVLSIADSAPSDAPTTSDSAPKKEATPPTNSPPTAGASDKN